MQLNILTLIGLAAWLVAQAEPPDKLPRTSPFAGDAQAVESARVMFRMSCAGCHGLHAKGGRSGPDLTRGTFGAGDTDGDLYRVISNGVAGTEMPAFGTRLEDDERWKLVSYIRSLAPREKVAVPGDSVAGEQLFWDKGGCGRCHRIGARGSSLGPNLTRAGRQRNLAYLRESVVNPNAEITPGYATVTVMTRDGRKIVGVERGFDNFSARLVDLNGRYYSFQKDETTSVDREYRSLMPLNYGRVFSERELDDLVAFLATLGGQQ